jgi:hypothetical protein
MEIDSANGQEGDPVTLTSFDLKLLVIFEGRIQIP